MNSKPNIEQLGISHTAMAARGLREYEEATTLELVEVNENGKQYRLTPAAAIAWRNLKAAARDDGIVIYLASAYRSVARQVEIIQTKLATGMGIDEILTLCAAPGYSEHHTGCAVDIATPGSPELEEEFEHTDAHRWLAIHAGRFGFTLSYPRGNAAGYVYEPWHWCHNETVIRAVSPPP